MKPKATLTTVELYACQNFIYSDPFYEVVDGFFARADSPLAQTVEAAGLEGTTICRPEGYPTGHLDEMGLLMPPAATLVQPTSAYVCFEQLMAGKVDLVALDTRAAERMVMDLGLGQSGDREPLPLRHRAFARGPSQVEPEKRRDHRSPERRAWHHAAIRRMGRDRVRRPERAAHSARELMEKSQMIAISSSPRNPTGTIKTKPIEKVKRP